MTKGMERVATAQSSIPGPAPVNQSFTFTCMCSVGAACTGPQARLFCYPRLFTIVIRVCTEDLRLLCDLAYADRNVYAAGIVRRQMTQTSGEAPAGICDVAIVTRRRSTAAADGRVCPGCASII